ncbi:MAG: carboxypeptidase regulatory-like domain-containing protein, partial [Terriglobia bacterium]
MGRRTRIGLRAWAGSVAGVLGVMLLGSGLLLAQGTTAAISGLVRDASGAVVPQATVTVRQVETGQTRVAETDAAGRYSLASLPVGPYELTVEKPGFRQLVRSGITLSVAQEAALNLTLEVGNVQQTVEVTGEAPIVNTTLAATSGLINEGQIQDMPLNGRSFDQLLTLNTGTVNNSSNTGGNWTGFSVAGKRPESNRFVMNGVDYVGDNATGVFVTPAGSSGQLLGVDAVREYNVLGHTYGAEYGKRAGGQITAVTISGTNQLHGSVFEYLRNSALDARNFFDATEGVPPFRRNQFGGSLGGPLIRDKMFLFGNYEGFRERLAVSNVVVTPDAQVRQGFLPCNLITPAPSPCPASGYAAAPNLKPGMLPFFRYFPEPNGPPVPGANGLPTGTAKRFSNPSRKVREDFGLLRYDYTMSGADSWSVNYTVADGDRAALGNELNPVFVNNTTNIAQTLSAQETHIFSPTVLNVATFGLSRGGGTAETVPVEPFPANLSFLTGDKAGNPGSINIGGGGLTTAVASIVQANGSNFHYNNRRIYSGSDDLRVVRGKHALSIGVWFQKVHQNAFSSGQGNAGTFTYPTLLAFLQDAPNQFLVNPNPTPFFFRSTEAAWYFQDEIKLLPNLTVRLGLRDEMTTGWNERDGHASNYNLDQNGVVLTQPYIGTSALLENNAIALWQPRVGVAWDPTGSGRWAVRAGFGIHNDLQDNLGIRLGSNFPFNARLTIPGPATAGGRGLLDIIPVAAGTVPPGPCTVVGQTNPPCSIFAPGGIDPAMHTPTISQWSLTVERGLTEDLMLQVSYVG